MQVILQENVSNLGFVGDVVKVKNGYARNFLLPKKLAVAASEQNIAQFEHQKKLIEVKKAKKKVEADALRARLQSVAIVLHHAAGENEKLFGSVTNAEIQAELLTKGFDLDRKLIRIETPIRQLGEHTVSVQLHQDVAVELKVTVKAKVES